MNLNQKTSKITRKLHDWLEKPVGAGSVVQVKDVLAAGWISIILVLLIVGGIVCGH